MNLDVKGAYLIVNAGDYRFMSYDPHYFAKGKSFVFRKHINF